MAEVDLHFGDGVIDYVVERVGMIRDASTTDKKFTESLYRVAISEEPDSAIDGKFYVDLRAVRPKAGGRHFGTGISTFIGEFVIEVGFRRSGGHKTGDGKTIARRAAADCQKIADVVEDPSSNYNSAKTGIRTITFAQQGAARVVSQPGREVWAVRFTAEWDSAIVRK